VLQQGCHCNAYEVYEIASSSMQSLDPPQGQVVSSNILHLKDRPAVYTWGNAAGRMVVQVPEFNISMTLGARKGKLSCPVQWQTQAAIHYGGLDWMNNLHPWSSFRPGSPSLTSLHM
jgi:hypothetical protein